MAAMVRMVRFAASENMLSFTSQTIFPFLFVKPVFVSLVREYGTSFVTKFFFISSPNNLIIRLYKVISSGNTIASYNGKVWRI